MPHTSISRRSLLGWGSLAALGSTVAGAGAAGAAPTFPDPGKDTPLAAIRSYGDMITQLERLATSSRYPVTVRTLSEIGTAEALSEQGRELYVATVGTGATPVWVQGRIHGNEPYGLDSTMSVLQSLATSGAPQWRAIREEFTVHVIPVYNPDGSEAKIGRASDNGRRPSDVSTCEGASGCVPSHISATGSPEPVRPRNRGMSLVEPQS